MVNKRKVMNNNDLRRHIMSFLRKYPRLSCSLCNSVCIWDNFVKTHYINFNHYDKTKVVSCIDCLDKNKSSFFCINSNQF